MDKKFRDFLESWKNVFQKKNRQKFFNFFVLVGLRSPIPSDFVVGLVPQPRMLWDWNSMQVSQPVFGC